MKILFVFAAFSIATVLGLSLPMGQGTIDIDLKTLERLTLVNEGRASNNLGDLFAGFIKKFVDDLGDPANITESISVPVFINDTIHINGVINATNVELSGTSSLNITDAIATLIPLGGDFTFYLPEFDVYGNYLIDLLETSLFPIPIYGEGPFVVKVSSTALKVNVKLGTTLTGHLKINGLTYTVDVYQIVGRIDGLFSDIDESGELNEAVNILFNSYASVLFNLFEANLRENITELAILVGNEILGNLTLADIIGIIGRDGPGTGPGQVKPFNLPMQM